MKHNIYIYLSNMQVHLVCMMVHVYFLVINFLVIDLRWCFSIFSNEESGSLDKNLKGYLDYLS
jgi:hypothetical protein